jgi:hypothetical protein
MISDSGPTSLAPIIEAAMGIVEESRYQYHILLIITDGQVINGHFHVDFTTFIPFLT